MHDEKVTASQIADPADEFLTAAEAHAADERQFVLPGSGRWSCEDVPVLVAAVRAVREIHRPFGIYDECGHGHTDQDVRDGTAVATHDFLTCRERLLYEVCTECCTGRSAPFGQTEDCADEHDHGEGKPICPTSAAITKELTGANDA